MDVPSHHRIRGIAPDDKDALVRFHARLSSEARYRRYHGSKGDLTSADLCWLTEVDGVDHVAIVAVDRAGEIDAVARVIADSSGNRGELAMVVADDRRRQGLGSLVTAAALEEFRAQGHEDPVIALVQPDNHPALRLLTRLGARRAAPTPGAPVRLLFVQSPASEAA